jgi:hypothetical protein
MTVMSMRRRRRRVGISLIEVAKMLAHSAISGFGTCTTQSARPSSAVGLLADMRMDAVSCRSRANVRISAKRNAYKRLPKRAQDGGFHVEDTHHRAIRTKGSVH